MRRQTPQRRVILRRQQQAEHAHAQAQRRVAKVQHAQIGQAQIDRDHGHAQRCEEFQHRRRQESDSQHFEAAHPHSFGGVAYARQLGIAASVQTDHSQPAQAVGEITAHARQRLELLPAGRFRTPAHQHHEQGNQRQSHQQDRADHAIHAEHRDQQGQRYRDHFRARQQVAAEIAFHGIGVGAHQFGELAAAALAQP